MQSGLAPGTLQIVDWSEADHATMAVDEENILRSDKIDQHYRQLLKEGGLATHIIDGMDHLMEPGYTCISNAMKKVMENSLGKDFSRRHDKLQSNTNETNFLKKYKEANHPYFIQKEDKTLEPINTMDCIRIFQKFEELKQNPEVDPILMSLLHNAKFNLKDFTIVKINDPAQTLELVKGKTYERPRGEKSLRNLPTNCNL